MGDGSLMSETILLLREWYPALFTFAVAAGAINAMMVGLKKSAKRMKSYKHPIYQGAEPLIPSVFGIVIGVITGPYVVPIELPATAHACAGVLMGSLSAQMYDVWDQGIAVMSGRVKALNPDTE